MIPTALGTVMVISMALTPPRSIASMTWLIREASVMRMTATTLSSRSAFKTFFLSIFFPPGYSARVSQLRLFKSA